MLTLKNCPCCGSVAHWTCGDNSTRMLDRVQCMGDNCYLELEGTYEPQSALIAWNKRVDSSDSTEC